MADINLYGDQFKNPMKPIEVATIVGEGETYQTVGDIPHPLLYPGKKIYDKENDIVYFISGDGVTPTAIPKIIGGFKYIHGVTQAEMDAINEDPPEMHSETLYLLRPESAPLPPTTTSTPTTTAAPITTHALTTTPAPATTTLAPGTTTLPPTSTPQPQTTTSAPTTTAAATTAPPLSTSAPTTTPTPTTTPVPDPVYIGYRTEAQGGTVDEDIIKGVVTPSQNHIIDPATNHVEYPDPMDARWKDVFGIDEFTLYHMWLAVPASLVGEYTHRQNIDFTISSGPYSDIGVVEMGTVDGVSYRIYKLNITAPLNIRFKTSAF